MKDLIDLPDVIEHFGSITALAKALDVTTQAVSQWAHTGIPELRAYQIEVLTDGRFKAPRPPAETAAAPLSHTA